MILQFPFFLTHSIGKHGQKKQEVTLLSRMPVVLQQFSLLIFANRLTSTCYSKCSYCWEKRKTKLR